MSHKKVLKKRNPNDRAIPITESDLPKIIRYLLKEMQEIKQSLKQNQSANFAIQDLRDAEIDSALSINQSKSLKERALRYDNNLKFILENDRNESESAIFINSKSQSNIENKYKDINVK